MFWYLQVQRETYLIIYFNAFITSNRVTLYAQKILFFVRYKVSRKPCLRPPKGNEIAKYVPEMKRACPRQILHSVPDV